MLNNLRPQRVSRTFGRGYAEDRALVQDGKQSLPREMSRSRCYEHLADDMGAAPRTAAAQPVTILRRGGRVRLDGIDVIYNWSIIPGNWILLESEDNPRRLDLGNHLCSHPVVVSLIQTAFAFELREARCSQQVTTCCTLRTGTYAIRAQLAREMPRFLS